MKKKKVIKKASKMVKKAKKIVKKAKSRVKKAKKMVKRDKKFEKVLHEFKEGELHSGSKSGPIVSNPKQALAISYSEEKRMKRKKRK